MLGGTLQRLAFLLLLTCLLWFAGASDKLIHSRGFTSSRSNLLGNSQGPLLVSRGGSKSKSLTKKDGIKNKKAVIVGGGPVGLATALTLSNEPHCYDVQVLEQSSQAGLFDPTKAYVYGITSRGQDWMEKCCPQALTKLHDKGTPFRSMTDAAVFSSDPSKPLPKSSSSTELEVFAKVSLGGTQNYWIPRHSMIQLLQELVFEQEHARKRQKNASVGSISILSEKQCRSMRVKEEDGMIEVIAETPKGKMQSFTGNLVVGADGVNSAVREFLGGRLQGGTEEQTSWLTAQPDKFRVKSWISPSGGLRMKVLQIPNNFILTNVDGTVMETDSGRLYMILSVYNGPYNRLRLGLLPTPQGSNVRTANSITRPNHEVWQLENGEAAKEWYKNAFPRLDWDVLVDDAEWERFAKANGTTFPSCQYCTGLQLSSPDETAGVVLLGDALHAFPPDLGQGINSGFSDVLALDRALRGRDIVSGKTLSSKETQPTLGAALNEYERVRGPETKALIRLARCGAPYQYRQSLRKDRIGHFLWTLNILVRFVLNKLTFGLIPPPALIMSMDKKLTFRQAMRRAGLVTAGFHATAFYLLCDSADKYLLGGRFGKALLIQIASAAFFLGAFREMDL